MALTRPQMFAGVTYCYFIAQRRDRHRIVPDLPLGLGAGWRRSSSTLVGVLLCLREPRFFDLWLTRVGRCPRVQELCDLAMQLLPALTRDRQDDRARAARGPSPALCAPCRRSHDRDPRRPADADRSTCAACCSRPPTPTSSTTASGCATRCCRRSARRASPSTTTSSGAGSTSSCRADYPDDFSRRLDAALARRGSPTKQLYVNELFLTLIRRPLQGRVGGFDRLRAHARPRRRPRRRRAPPTRLRQLDAARDALIAALGHYAPRLLGVYQTPQGPCSEPLEFLSALYNGEMRPVLLPMQDLGAYLPYRRVSFGQETVELGPAGPLPRSFVGLVSIKDYPGQTAPGMLDELLRLPFELVVSQSFAFVDRQAALSRMNLALRRMRSAEDEAVSLRADLSSAKDEVAAGRAGFGEHHMTIAVRGRHAGARSTRASPRCRRRSPTSASSRCARRSRSSRPSGRSSPATSNISPGAAWSRPAISRASPAATTSRSARRDGNHWGEAVTLLETTAAGPYYFNFHQGDLGNFTVIGPSGSGKTVVLNFLLAQARKFRPRIIFFDKDRGAELFIRAIGGRYDLLRARRRPPGSTRSSCRHAGQPPVPDRLAVAARRRRRHRRDRADQGRGRRQLRSSRSSIAGCATSPSCSAAATGRTPPTSGRGSGPGGATASAPGCSTTSATGPTSRPRRSAST